MSLGFLVSSRGGRGDGDLWGEESRSGKKMGGGFCGKEHPRRGSGVEKENENEVGKGWRGKSPGRRGFRML